MAVFALASSWPPGPNNIMLTASGVNFGFTRSVPHIAGVIVGYGMVLLAAGSGLGVLFQTYPGIQLALKIVGAAYMIWLAWKVANARPAQSGGAQRPEPLSFLQAAAFQWVNPKGVVTALSAAAIFVRPSTVALDLSVMVPIFLGATFVSVLFWTGFGSLLSDALQNPLYARIFNVTMAILIVASIAPMVL